MHEQLPASQRVKASHHRHSILHHSSFIAQLSIPRCIRSGTLRITSAAASRLANNCLLRREWRQRDGADLRNTPRFEEDMFEFALASAFMRFRIAGSAVNCLPSCQSSHIGSILRHRRAGRNAIRIQVPFGCGQTCPSNCLLRREQRHLALLAC